MNNITIIVNKYGHKQSVDNEGNEICDECGRCYINFGNGICCEKCNNDALEHCEQIYGY